MTSELLIDSKDDWNDVFLDQDYDGSGEESSEESWPCQVAMAS
jgi:hypothetical protein